MPDLGVVDFESIDAILISNYTTMLALPFITEETPFNGNIYITEPTLHFGRLFMEETIEFLEQCSPRSSAKSLSSMPIWKTYSQHLPGNLQSIGRIFKCIGYFLSQRLIYHLFVSASECKTYRKIYTRQQIESCLNKVTLVGFSEQKDIFGLIKVSPVSSGFCIGSSNWVINSGFEKIAYVSR